MKNILFIVLISFTLFCCDQSASSKIDVSNKIKSNSINVDLVDTPSNAFMEFSDTVWDFGLIESEEVVSFSFEFTNTGTDPLIISSAKGSCGCTVPVWPREPIAPGAGGVIDVKFNSKGKKGKQNKRVTLTTNMVPSQQILTVKGEVKTKEQE